ncbi:hypothetical protein V6N13_083988 [Hibiscus sabdariffa]|uniref:Uncharacterized protein n=1 Tax=Hibiscus sabdariffa TaxID=183260 RepID=A0ABR2SZN4_9ROSI
MENPSNAAPILFDNYSGRPPEDPARRSGLLILERPGSPSILKEQNCSKKGRCGDTHVTYNNPLGVSDMDTEGADVALEKEVSIEDGSAARQDLKPNDEVVPDTTGKKTYASMAAGSHDRRPGKEHIGCFDADNITVLEEDVIIDVLVPAESSKANTEATNSSIYGSWMMVPNRRRRNVRNIPKQQVSDSNNVITADVGGSRFASLVEEGTLVEGQDNSRAPVEQHRVDHEVVDVDGSICNEEEATRLMNPAPEKHVVRNVAYMASNPDKKVKSPKNAAKGINVVSMSNGQAAVVKERRDNKLSGNHQVVVIEEVGGRKSHVFGSRSTILRGVTGVAEWAQSLSHQLSQEELASNTGRHVVNQDTGQGSHVSNDTTVVQDLPMSELGPQDKHRPSEGQ